MAEYIERDKAIEKINYYCELRQAIYSNDKDEFLRGLQTALKAISYNDVIPNADVQPVRRGRWTWDSNAPHREHGAYKCSNCGCHSDFEENYCPNCGADMRGKGND